MKGGGRWKSASQLFVFLLPPPQLCCQPSQGFKQSDNFSLPHLSTIVPLVRISNEKHQSQAHTQRRRQNLCIYSSWYQASCLSSQWSEITKSQVRAFFGKPGDTQPCTKKKEFSNNWKIEQHPLHLAKTMTSCPIQQHTNWQLCPTLPSTDHTRWRAGRHHHKIPKSFSFSSFPQPFK